MERMSLIDLVCDADYCARRGHLRPLVTIEDMEYLAEKEK